MASTSAKYDFDIIQGVTCALSFSFFSDQAQTQPLDITDRTFEGKILDKYGGNVIGTFVFSPGADDHVKIGTIEAADTANIPSPNAAGGRRRKPTPYPYYVKCTLASSDEEEIVYGTASVYPGEE